MSKLLTFGILFSTTVTAVVVAKLVILGILPLTSFIEALIAVVVARFVIPGTSALTEFPLVLRVALVAKIVIPGILSSTVFILALYTSFWTTSFLLHHLVYFNE